MPFPYLLVIYNSVFDDVKIAAFGFSAPIFASLGSIQARILELAFITLIDTRIIF